MKVVTAEIMRELDSKTIETYGIPGLVLMENAGKGCAASLMKHYPDVLGNVVSLFCGAGNNGGDGYVMARYLLDKGVKARVCLLVPEEHIQGDARTHLDILRHRDAKIYSMTDEGSLERYKIEILHSKVLVDAILGTGLRSEVKGHYRRVIEWINETHLPVFAVDIPSGIHADNGQVMGCAVKANRTVTFGMPKRGQFLHPGIEHVGALEVVDIGIPQELMSSGNFMDEIIDPAMFKDLLTRKPDTHKGTYGHLLVLAGSPGKTGAACLCSESALRVGAGLVTLAIAQSINPIMEQKLTEVMTLPLPEKDKRILPDKATERILEFLPAARALAVGPGLGLDKEVERLIEEMWMRVTVPMVWDADALTLLAKNPGLRGRHGGPVVVSPHPGEMARLVEKPTSWVQQNRIEAAQAFAKDWNVVTVLKGARSLIADPSGRLSINPTGNPGMATGGMGDVLTGMIGGLLAQGVSPFDAARLATFVHGAAGDVASKEIGPVGYLASELMHRIPSLIREFSIASAWEL